MDDITLECGCIVELIEEYQHGCAGDCHPGSYEVTGGRITKPCSTHDSEVLE